MTRQHAAGSCLEICVDTHAGLNAAVKGGADRIELCSALQVGGLSPSLALLEAACASPVPVYVMVRPRDGGFRYDPVELAGMEKEIAQVREMGLAGVVFGAGDDTGLDFEAMRRLCTAAQGLGKTLHRVVDLLPERLSILDPVRQLGFERILTSGGGAKAIDALSDISCLVKAGSASGGLTIMPGSGVTPENVSTILSATGAREVHASAAVPVSTPSTRLVDLGFSAVSPKSVSEKNVRRLKAAVSGR
ncbi:copper homeostasis protein CutC [Labrenzia sp. 011]|uniref:copper homeostasis protein CutC n=1 Tax=Labrenzia sp. 011 TaxID=2171494 RepID=UPI000D50C02E|nr:copper homeostasis protein CutC [Labrenzia sp. 011]PVB60599.1 copper homeostasis protein CutC [Labrenzia sp. 011]